MDDLRSMIQGVLQSNADARAAERARAAEAKRVQELALRNWQAGKAQRLAYAKIWLCKHFNTEQVSDTLFDPPTFAVNFHQRAGVTYASVKLRWYGELKTLPRGNTFMWIDKYGEKPVWCEVLRFDGVWLPTDIELVPD